MKTCKDCNLSYADDKKFCKKCGKPLTTEYQIDPKDIAKKTVFEDRIKTDPLNVGLLQEYAQFLFNTQLFKETITVSLKILVLSENDRIANELLYKSYSKLNMLKEALEFGKQLLSENPTDILLLQELAQLSGKMGFFCKATEYYDQILELQPANVTAFLNKAHNFLKENQLEKAIEIFNHLYQEGQNDRITSIYAGINKALEGNFESSIELLNLILSDYVDSKQNDIDTSRGVLYLAYSLCRNSSKLHEIKKWAKAINYDILKQNYHPLDEQTAFFIAEYVINQSLHEIKRLNDRKILSNANSQISELTVTYLPKNFYSKNYDPKIAEIWYSIGLMQSELQLFDDAIQSFKKASDLVPNEKKYKEKYSEHTKLLGRHIRKRKRKIGIIIAASVLGVIIIVFSIFTYKNIKEKDAFNLAKEVNSSSSYQVYLDNYPNGKFSSEALKLRTAARALDEMNAYDEARNVNTFSSYQAYMDKYPKGKYYSEALRLQGKAKELVEKNAFDEAKKKNTSRSYQLYMDKYPKGKYYSAAFRLKVKAETGGRFTDSRDGNVYEIIIIGNQIWMAKNLAYLPSVSPPTSESGSSPLYYVYNYHGTNVADAKATSNYQTYGVLYNWSAALSACPPGWHLPSDAEWTTLTDYLGGEDVAGGKMKEAGTSHWVSPNVGATNESGFTALPGGERYRSDAFEDIGALGYWWSSSEFLAGNADYRRLNNSNSKVYSNATIGNGFSVRCIRD